MYRRSKLILLSLCGLLVCSTITSAFALESQKLPIEKLRVFSEAFGRIQSDFIEPVDGDKLINAAISGMVNAIDPTGSYLDAADFRTLVQGIDAASVGVEMGIKAGKYKIISPIEDAPAYRAGIKAGDCLIRLNGKETSSVTFKELQALLRGKVGSPIEIAVEREGVSQPLVFQMKREVVKIQSVKPKLIEPGYGYIRITRFEEDTGASFVGSLKTLYLENKRPLDGLILDMRNNPGGLLTAAIAVSAVFLPDNALVTYTEGRSEDARMRLTSSKENWLRKGEEDYWHDLPQAVKLVPLVVLVNRGSAAAPEIVAGALQDHKRAIVVGENTFGKSTVSTVFPLSSDTAIKITTAHWHTPNGTRITDKGIKPDVEVKPKTTGKNFQLGTQEDYVYEQAIYLLKGISEQKLH